MERIEMMRGGETGKRDLLLAENL